MAAASKRVLALAALLRAVGVMRAQDSPRAFEVVSVKLANSVRGAYLAGGPGSSDPTHFRFMGASMGALVRRAYGVESYQLSWPAGLPDGYFDIDAKVPPDTGEAQFEAMLRSMLMDRLGMRTHHDTRELAGYEMVTARTGVRIRAAERTASPPPEDIPVGRIPLIKDRNGELQLPPGRSASLTIRLSDERFRKSGRRQTMADLAQICARELGRPVADRTGLAGVYDFDVDFARSPDDPREAQDDAATPFAIAVQSQLGLRLESRRVPVDVIVIDHINRKPYEN